LSHWFLIWYFFRPQELFISTFSCEINSLFKFSFWF